MLGVATSNIQHIVQLFSWFINGHVICDLCTADQNEAMLQSASHNKCFWCKATKESPAVSSGFPPSPGFPEASPAKDLLFYFELLLVQ